MYIDALFNKEATENFYEYRALLGKLFYEKVGIVRENGTLEEALKEAVAIEVVLNEEGIADKQREHNQNLVEFLEFRNVLFLAPMVISSAMARDESRGAHYKVGFESEEKAFQKHIVLQWKEEMEREMV
jgi:succinate dehydrogenase / fumarate reductase flavoprotein subunit